MFLHLSVILFTGGLADNPWKDTPSGQTPLLGRHPPPGQTPIAWADTPRDATVVDGTHPAGMHSCWLTICTYQIH